MTTLIRAVCVVVAAGVLLYAGSATAAKLSVCIDTSNPMAPVESRLAQAVAAHEHATLDVHRFDSNAGDPDEAYDMQDFAKLADKHCALVMGFPIDVDATRVDLGGLRATAPYAHTGFALVAPKASRATTLAQLPRGSKVEVTYLTTPNMYFIEHPDLIAGVARNTDEALKTLVAGDVDAAMLWQPAVTRYLAEHHLANRYAVHPLRLEHANFNLVALYDTGHASEAAAFERAIAAMRASGQLRKLLAPYVEDGALPMARPMASAQPTAMRRSFRGHANAGKGACAARANSATKAKAAADVRPALYTDAQAASGKQKFLDNCSVCHGEDLGGDAGPALKGRHFAPATSDYHVGDIFTIVTHNMPATQPGSLPHDDYVEIMAFLLQQNGYPAGGQALTYEDAMKSKVQFVSEGK